MGTEFHRLVMAALAAGLLVIPGCGAGDGKTPTGTAQEPPPGVTSSVAPTVVSASIEGTSVLHLTFTEAIAPATGVDPAKFRLTVGYYTKPSSSAAGSKYSYTYANTKTYNGYEYSGTNHTIYSEVADIASINIVATSAEQLDLQLGSTFSLAGECAEIAALNAEYKDSQAGLYLHYAEAGTPTIQDTFGNQLASIADYWVASPTLEQVSGDFTGRPIPVSISCSQ